MRRLLLVPTLLIAGACSSADPALDDGTWVGTITTEGNVTTVVNESGSVWGGTARLVEEVSIGVEAGEEAYMFGRILGLAATDDRIFVLDSSIPTVRVFDAEGTHLYDIGRQGSGPGEFRRPSDIKVSSSADRLYVRDDSLRRIAVFDLAASEASGGTNQPLETWPMGESGYGTLSPMVLGVDGRLYIQHVVERGERFSDRRIGMVPYSSGRPAGEAIVEPWTPVATTNLPAVVGPGVRLDGPVPFSPRYVWTMSRALALIVGTSDRYRFEIRRPDAITVVERRIEPVPLEPEEAAWHKRARIAINRNIQDDWSWGDAPMPEHKPFYEDLYADLDGRVWVRRRGPGIQVPDCDENPNPGPASRIRSCWQDTMIFELFDIDGRFVGEVDLPQTTRFSSKPFITGDTVILIRENDAGTIMVKRYRLVLPGEE